MNAFLKVGTAAAIGALALMSPAKAALTPVQSQPFSFSGDLNQSTNLSFNGFSSGLGTLLEVIMTFSASVTLNNAVFNFGSGVNVGSPIPLTATASFLATTTFVPPTPQLSVSTSLTTPGYAGPIAGPNVLTTVGTATSNLSGSASVTNILDLPNYIGGAGLFSVTMSSTGTQGGSVPPTVFSGNNGSSSGTVTIQYRYEEPPPPTGAPEPASMALLGVGLLGVGLLRRRAK